MAILEKNELFSLIMNDLTKFILEFDFFSVMPEELTSIPRYRIRDHSIQKRIFNSALFWAVVVAEIKNLNCHKHATFEVSFCFSMC